MRKKITKVTTSIRLTPRMRERLEELAEKKEITASELIRRVLENYIEQRSI